MISEPDPKIFSCAAMFPEMRFFCDFYQRWILRFSLVDNKCLTILENIPYYVKFVVNLDFVTSIQLRWVLRFSWVSSNQVKVSRGIKSKKEIML